MSWFGKIVGGTIGLMLGGPLGAIGGAALGHYFVDKPEEQVSGRAGGAGFGGGQFRGGPFGGFGRGAFGGFTTVERIQATYFVAVFSILGKIAKADGTVTKAEGDLVLRFIEQMGLQGQSRQFAIDVFNEAKSSPYSVEDLAGQLFQISAGRREIHLNFIDMLFQIAVADGVLRDTEESMIRRVARVLHLDESTMESIKRKYQNTADAAYRSLGVTPEADNDEIRDAYRKLVRENHPDRVIAKGMPEEFVQFATRRFQEIQDAYETIKRERGIA